MIVQVGHNSVRDARELASHAQNCGADVISATCPSYFKVSNVTDLVETMAEVAGGAPELPFYYYHIPSLTGSTIDMPEFLDRASRVIPNLVGLKYTDTKLFEYQSCLALNDGQFDIVWGCDEMLLGAWATGARGAIGSTYNIAAPWYLKLIDAFSQGDLQQSRHWQMKSVDMVRTLGAFPFHPAMKAILQMQGFDFGSCRSPLGRLSEDQVASLRQQAIRLGLVE